MLNREDMTNKKMADIKIFKNINKLNMRTEGKINIKELGAIGDGKTNNKEIIRNIFNNIENGYTVEIPLGEYYIKLSDEDLIDTVVGTKRMFYFIKLENLNNVNIIGNGTLIFDSTECSKKTLAFLIKDCQKISVTDLKIIGDAIFTKEGYIDDSSAINIFEFEHCDELIFCFNNISNVMIPLIITGDKVSPSRSGLMSYDSIVMGNTFKNYGQVSTFGGGASRFIFSNNICVNPIQCALKVSTDVINTEEINMVGNSYALNISNNVITWEEDFEFPKVGWSPSNMYCPVGVMLQSHSINYKLENNLIDMSKVKQPMVNPIQVVACLSIMLGGTDDTLRSNSVIIDNNSLFSCPCNNLAFSSVPQIDNYIIKNNNIKGNFAIGTGNTITKQYSLLEVSGNTFYNDTAIESIMIGNVDFKKMVFKDNTIYSDAFDTTLQTSSIFQITSSKIKNLWISNNSMDKTDIRVYGSNPIEARSIVINSNSIQSISLVPTDIIEIIEISNNVFDSNKTSCTLVNIPSNCKVNFNNNSGRTIGAILNTSNGEISLTGNYIVSSSQNKHILGDSFVSSGTILGVGEPNINARYGVMYINYGTTVNATYLKTTVSGATGWKQL